MVHKANFSYRPSFEECEKASYAYVISTVVVFVALPIPIAALLSTFFYYVANRNSRAFVRWHAIQSLLSQVVLFVFNSTALWWFVSKYFFEKPIPNLFFYYLGVVVILNILEFSFSVYSAIQVRKGQHVEWPIFESLIKSRVKTE
ncbi:hypothetical protein [Flavobacteriaceae bacterium 14752]|uniref:hypothetical protein n=1 Tax=Mesohalobacter salilacus TaxID=2491711 RepID=UPI000F62C503|nr:hypothetical protein EIG84_02100 [Flavobacteriaceae bacterium 14752]